MGTDPQRALDECKKFSLNFFCDLNYFHNEAPLHIVYLDSFIIGRYEVTNRQYTQCVRAGVCIPPGNGFYYAPEYEEHPVININWYDAQTFCSWAEGRLPTEAEWEKAARGGLVGKLYPWGDEEPICISDAPNGANSRDYQDDKKCPDPTMPVGSFLPNGYGLYDMAGNVAEWVNDWYSADYYYQSPSKNPIGPENGEKRVIRGGAWSTLLRSAQRGGLDPIELISDVGFRCARSLP